MDKTYDDYAQKIINHYGLIHKSGSEYGNKPCPNCGGTDRFWISKHEGRLVHHCRQNCNFVERQKALQRDGVLPVEKAERTEAKHSPDTPYHTRKQIELRGNCAVCDGDTVVIEIVDIRTDEPRGNQFIKPDGSKRFTPKLRKEGAGSFIGEPTDVTYVTEGWADAVIVHQATGKQALFALDAGNIPKTVAILKDMGREVIVAADSDEAGIKAAKASGAPCVLPKGAKDWWDVFDSQGLEAVAEQLQNASLMPQMPLLDHVLDINLEPPKWLIEDGCDKFEGKVPRNTANVFAMLTQTERWRHVFALDELQNRCIIIAKPPFQTGAPQYFKPRPVSDNDYTHVLMWIERHWGNVKKQVVIDAINAACDEQRISPVRHYLESLPPSEYDIGCFFEEYFGVVPENELHKNFIRNASKLFLKQAVARAVNVGCKADIVIVLEGKQGIGKSTGLRALFSPDWFKDSLPPMSSKDAADYVVGAWCIELAEMAFQRKSEIEHQKAFISRQEEKYRPAYARKEVVYPRRCVFVATTNRDDWAVDETGNRRFLPIKTTKIDVAGVKRDRDVIWAAAYAAYLQDPMWWMTDEMAAYTAGQNKTRHEADVWVELINEKMADLSETSVREAFEVCFAQTYPDDQSQNPRKIETKDQRRMSKCLQMAGWEKEGRFTSGKRRDQVRFVRMT